MLKQQQVYVVDEGEFEKEVLAQLFQEPKTTSHRCSLNCILSSAFNNSWLHLLSHTNTSIPGEQILH